MGKEGKKRSLRPKSRPKAATREVLGYDALEPVAVNPKWERYYRRLSVLHEALLSSKEELVHDAQEEQPVFSLHMADAGTDAYDRDFALGMISSEQNALYEIEEALNRIRDGTYGICQLTGKPIEPERLNAIPWTRFSAAAEAQLEQQGAVSHAKLGDREEVEKTEPAEEGEED